MKKHLLLLGIFLLLSNFVLAGDDLRKKAEDSPLDCALYLSSTGEVDFDQDRLASALFSAKRYDDVFQVLSQENRFDLGTASYLADQLLKQGDKSNAEKFISKVLEKVTEDDSGSRELRNFIGVLIAAGHFAEVDEIIAKLDNEYPDYQAKLYLAAANACQKSGRPEKALEYLEQVYKLRDSLEETYDRIQLAELYAKLGKDEQVAALIEQIETRALKSTDKNEPNITFMQLVPLYFATGRSDKGMERWQQYHALTDTSDNSVIAKALIGQSRIEEALPYLQQMALDHEQSGTWLVETYLKLNDTENAVHYAKNISSEDDSYNQQSALISIADKFIETGKTEAALNILDFAFQKARRVGETHRTEDSEGASPLTRKVVYIRNILGRYIKLKRFDKAQQLFGAFKTRHEFIQKSLAESYIMLAEAQLKTLPAKKLNELLAQAQNAVASNGKDNDSYAEIKTAIDVADIYAKLGDRAKAVELLANSLKRANEEEFWSLDQALIWAGKVFEEDKLKATPKLRKILREIIGDDPEAKK
jgi:tetratricopeptide (TPR) repeat protein